MFFRYIDNKFWVKKRILNKAHKTIGLLYSVLYPIEKKVVFESFAGNQYSDNPRAISEKLHDKFPDFKIVWKLNKNVNRVIVPPYVTIVENDLEFIKELVTSFCYVTNENNESDKVKRKKQFFVQTWHGDRGFKKILYDAWGDKKRPTPVTDNIITDICMSGSTFGTEVYRSAFAYDGIVLEKGCARNDCLINRNTNKQNDVRRFLDIKDDTKILLYAPTFRDNIIKENNCKVNVRRVLDLLEKNGNDWVCLIRSHPMFKSSQIDSYDQRQIDVSDYSDMADLLMVSDMLITDYSSCASDFALTKKPIIMAAFDYNEYIKNCRAMKANIYDTGFIIANNQESLEEILSNTSASQFAKACDDVIKYYGVHETGMASEMICEEINRRYISVFHKN